VQVVPSANPSVLAFVRADRRSPESDREVNHPVLCVHNLSRTAQPADLDVTEWAGRQPVELLGRVAFPLVGTDAYAVTLGPYGSLSFELV
ncbi:MAG: trehalose synthase, partial [Proteobacteria bacterium]|nr:trehalose synthase [Pseudomonadota bacterium]